MFIPLFAGSNASVSWTQSGNVPANYWLTDSHKKIDEPVVSKSWQHFSL